MSENRGFPQDLRARAAVLRDMTDTQVIQGLAQAMERWGGENGLAAQAARELAEQSGQSRDMLFFGLGRMVKTLSRDGLTRWLEDARQESGQASGLGPRALVQILAGNVAGLVIPAVAEALLARSAVLVKPASGDRVTPRLMKQALDDAAPQLGQAVRVDFWRGGTDSREQDILDSADFVVATGGEEMTLSLQERLPSIPHVLYGPRLTVGVVGESWKDAGETWWNDLTREIVLWDQQGCLSPRILFVIGDVRRFSKRLAAAMDRLENTWPARTPEAGTASEILGFRSRYAMGDGVNTGCLEPGNLSWTVVWDHRNDTDYGPPARVVRVAAIDGEADADEPVRSLTGRLQGLGLAFVERHREWDRVPLVADLTRIQDPPVGWRADGRSGLAGLLSHARPAGSSA